MKNTNEGQIDQMNMKEKEPKERWWEWKTEETERKSGKIRSWEQEKDRSCKLWGKEGGGEEN